MNSIFILAISIIVFGLGYILYSRLLARKILSLDDSRSTPAQTLQDGKDYVPTSRWTTFFYHFATISGSGVLVGPTLAAQYGWLPCLIWILTATCLAGGVHDMVVLTASVRNGAKSIAQIALAEVGPVTGTAMMIAIIFMVTTAMAGFGLGAVAALAHNPWGTFAIAMSVPIALFLAAYLRWIRPGRVMEASLIGVGMLVVALLFGGSIPETRVGRLFDMDRGSLTIALAIYGFVAAALPVGILVRPRDYLSAFIKIGVVVLLFAGIAISMPKMQMPAVSSYVSGGGPVISGSLWPFLFIIITCGAISGWHALCCSGVTPKLISKESDIRPVAYGGWLLESCCAILALILAGMLLPADYYAINAKTEAFAKTGLTPQAVATFNAETGINVAARTGGPASLAFSMTDIFARLSGGLISKSQLYQFFILFLGLFIVAVMDHGTRMSRYFIQELASKVKPSLGQHNWTPGIIIASALAAFLWGGLLYTGEIETLWPVFGICNQLLACTALAVGTTFILKRVHAIYGLTTFIPMLFFAAACIHGGIIRCLACFTPAAKSAERVQGAIIAVAMILVLIVIVDSCLKGAAIMIGKSRK